MKKVLGIILFLTLATISFAGCSKTPTNTPEMSSSSQSSLSISESSFNSIESSSAMSEVSKAVESTVESTTTAGSTVSSETFSASQSKIISAISSSSRSAASATSSDSLSRGGNPYKPASATLSGTISISGSTSVYPVIAALAEAFKIKYSKVSINITNIQGSDAGKEDARANRVSFGMYSASITDTAFTVYKIALDGVALVVNPSNPLTNITYNQLERIYNTTAGLTVSGATLGTQINNWNELGISYDKPIIAVSRENGSGTRTCFQDIIKGIVASTEKKYPLASGYDSQAGRTEIASSTDQVREKIATNPNAIGYMSLGSVNSTVKKLQYESVNATTANVLNGTYKFSRPFNLLTKAGDKLTAVESEFLKFILSTEGQTIIENSHFISLDNAQINDQLAKIPQ